MFRTTDDAHHKAERKRIEMRQRQGLFPFRRSDERPRVQFPETSSPFLDKDGFTEWLSKMISLVGAQRSRKKIRKPKRQRTKRIDYSHCRTQMQEPRRSDRGCVEIVASPRYSLSLPLQISLSLSDSGAAYRTKGLP